MSYLTIAQIAAADDLQVQDVEVPEWGGTVKVKGMSAGERLQLAAIVQDEKMNALQGIAHFALLHGVVEPKITEENLDMFLSKSSKAIDRIVEVFNKLSGSNEEAVLESRGNS